MPVNTRNTRHSTNLQHFQELPHKNIRTNNKNKTKVIKKQHHYHQQLESSSRKQSLINTQREQAQEITLQRIQQQAKARQDAIKLEDIVQICRPPPKKGRKGKQVSHPPVPPLRNMNLRSKKIVTEGIQIGSNQVEIKLESDNPSSSEINKSNAASEHLLPNNNQSTSPSPQTKQAQNMIQMQKQLMEESMKRKQLEDAMQSLAKLDNQQTNVISGPFLVLQQYRPVIESKIEMEYRQLLKINGQLGDNVLRQKINFIIARDKERKQFESDSSEQKDLLQGYREMEDYLFYKCKQLNEQELLDYKRSAQYKEIHMKLIQLHPYHAYKQLNPKKKINLHIQKNIFSHKLSSKVHKKDTSSQITMHRPHKISEKASNHSQGQAEKNSEIYIKIESEYQGLQSQVKTPSIKINQAISAKTSSPYDRGFGEQFCRKKQLNKRYEGNLQTSVEPVNQALNSVIQKTNQNVTEGSNPDEYDRDRILQIIQTMNKRTNLDDESNTEQKNIRSPIEKSVSQVARSKTASVKSQAITGSIKPPTIQQPSLTNSQVLSTFELNQAKFQGGFDQIEIITRQSGDKTEQTTKHERISNNSRNQAKSSTKYYNISNQSWQPFNRNPKVKQRLQILNRFHYNPFEIENGDDQCDLWRRLMTEEIDDLKSHYKYEEPNEYFINDSQKYDKGYVLPLKVKEQDFFITTRYDPLSRAFKQEIQSVNEAQRLQNGEGTINELNNQMQQRQVKREIIEFDDGFAYATEGTIPNQGNQITEENDTIQEGKSLIDQKGQQQARLDESGRSFNYDLLEGFQIPELAQENEPTKIIEYDFT